MKTPSELTMAAQLQAKMTHTREWSAKCRSVMYTLA